VAAAEAWQQSGVDSFAAGRAGIVLGRCQASRAAAAGCRPLHELADTLADQFGLAGPRIVITTACAAGGNAIGGGLDLLRSGSADLVLAGGVDVLLRETLAGFGSLKAVSPTATSPYSRSDGLSLGEAAAFLVLESAAHAEARGATVLAEIAGYGLSADAFHATSPDPSGRGAVTAVRRGLAHAGFTETDVSYVNGHGTGTPANDRMESRAMRVLFGERTARVPVSSTKSAIGHTLGAAGAVEAVACVLSVRDDLLPPTVNVTSPPPAGLDIVPGRGRSARVDVAVSASYAFGGNNCSVIVGKYRPSAGPTPQHRRVVISGIGALAGAYRGVAQFRSVLREGRPVLKRLQSFTGAPYGCDFGLEPEPVGGRPLAPASLWRHMDAFSRQVLAAAAGAWEDAGLLGHRGGRDEVDLIFATGYGPVRTAAGLADAAAGGGVVNAVDFANSVANAAAGAVCQAMNLRGPTTTVASGGVSAVIALDIAADLIRTGRADQILVVAADDLCELVLRARAGREPLAADGVVRPYDRRRAGTVLGAAAVALLLETADRPGERGRSAYCEVSAVSHLGCPSDVDTAVVLDAVLRSALVSAGRAPSDVDLCVGYGHGAADDVAELRALDGIFADGVSLCAPASLFGDCEAGSGGINLMVGALAVAEGLVPVTANLTTPETGLRVRHVTVPSVSAGPASVRWVLANAASARSSYGTALLSAVGEARR
jgi:3-oxoacyl-[acyl-carrier-protein] synthase II